MESLTEGRKSSIRDVITPMRVIYEELVQARFFQSRREEAVKEERLNKGYCQYHAKIQEHVIQECIEFRDIVQNLMDRKEIEFLEPSDPFIDVITGTTYSKTPSSIGPKPITIFHDNETARDEMPKVSTPVLVVEVPSPFHTNHKKQCLGTTTAIILIKQLLLTLLALEALPGASIVMPLIW